MRDTPVSSLPCRNMHFSRILQLTCLWHLRQNERMSSNTMTLRDYCRETGRNYRTVCQQLKRGLGLEDGYRAERCNHPGVKIPRYRVHRPMATTA